MASTFSDISVPVSEDCTPPCIQPNSSMNIDNCVAEDSLSDDNDLYLINCKIHIVGFDASEMRKLVNMVRRGGGSRYMSLNEQLTHIVVGDPSE
nr:DNA topoisomerase 2-binding protein 1 isoform X1 [Tanacetum cinerariifolium]